MSDLKSDERSSGVPFPGPGSRPLPAEEGRSADPLLHLIERAQGRDPEAQEELLRQFAPLIRATVQHYAGGAGLDPEDLGGEAVLLFLRLVQRFDPARGVDFPGYIHQMFPAALHTYARRQQAQERPAPSSPARDPAADCTTQGLLWEEHLVDSLCLREALSRLSPRQRQVLVYSFFGALTEQEIAAKLGITQPRISALRQQALQRLRKILQEF